MLVSRLNPLSSKLLTPPRANKRSVIEKPENTEEFESSLQSIGSVTIKSNLNSEFAVTKKIDSEQGKTKKLKNGRWTKEECKLFEEALKKFGKRWKKVEAYVSTRTGTQVRSHAQKYFMKVKGESLSTPHNQSVAPTTSIGMTQEKPETDCMKVKDNNEEKSPALTPLEEVTVECRYLLEHMRKFGFSSTNEIYKQFNKLSDWIATYLITTRTTIIPTPGNNNS